jgi:hypothetical protein
MKKTKAADATKLIASPMTATGAESAATRTPPTPGPTICAALRLTSSFELPSTISSRSTSEGR